jgi:glycine/D-amino acid oxidase-like deaminating enzyme
MRRDLCRDEKPHSIIAPTSLVNYQERTYWLDTVSMPTGTDGPLPEAVDVAVIGAGFTGLSAAHTFAKHGVGVAVLEAKTIGWGASSRNGGMVLPGLKLGVEILAKRYGMEVTRRMYAATLSAIDCVEQIVAEESIDCNFSRCGDLQVACKPSHFNAYQKSAELMAREFNHQTRVVTKSELPAEIGSHLYYGGLVDEVSAGVNPARYVAGLARAAQKAGAQIYEGTQVSGIEKSTRNGTSGFTVRNRRGLLFAKDVLVGTSGYTDSMVPKLRQKIIPIGSFIVATEPLSEGLARELIPRNRMISDSKHYLHYYRLTPDGRMLFGGRAAFFPETSTTIRRSVEILGRDMLHIFPQLRDVKVDYAWGGTLDFAFDMMPHAGQTDGIYYSVGYAGHGVAMATYLGSKVAEAVCGGADANPFRDIPFPDAPFGLYKRTPWFLPLAGAWYKVLDWVR